MEGDSGKALVSLIIPFFLIGIPAGLIAFIIDYFDKGLLGDPLLAAITGMVLLTGIGSFAFLISTGW